MAQVYRGWIHGKPEDAEVLRDLGVKLGPWVDDLQAWTPCDVTTRALYLLNRMGERFIWGFYVVEGE